MNNLFFLNRRWLHAGVSAVIRAAFLLAVATMTLLVPSARAADRKIENRISPVYPELARRMHVSGLVKVMTTVAPDGSVLSVKATTGNRMLAPAAEEAVKRWKFAPATEESTMDIDVNFQMND